MPFRHSGILSFLGPEIQGTIGQSWMASRVLTLEEDLKGGERRM